MSMHQSSPRLFYVIDRWHIIFILMRENSNQQKQESYILQSNQKGLKFGCTHATTLKRSSQIVNVFQSILKSQYIFIDHYAIFPMSYRLEVNNLSFNFAEDQSCLIKTGTVQFNIVITLSSSNNNKIKYPSMSYNTINLKQAKKTQLATHAKSFSYINHQELKQLQTVLNVSYTDYCGLSFKKRSKDSQFDSKKSLSSKKKIPQFWKIRKNSQLALQRGDSFRIQPAKMHENSPRLRQQRINTEYSHSKIYRSKGKNLNDFYKFYELGFLQKKMATLEAEGHKLQLAKFNNIKPKQRKGMFRPITGYMKRNHLNSNDVRKIKTVDFKNLNKRQESLYVINGWESQMPQQEM